MKRFTEFLIFVKCEPKPGAKTEKWLVYSKQTGALLTTIKWRGSWRRYTDMPEPDTFFDAQCHRDIADFLEELQDKWRALQE